ncbi:hypothetical protein ACFQ60_36645 [Streptomyces zhihengii]
MSLDAQTRVLDWPFARTENGEPAPILDELRKEPPCAVRIPEGATESRLAWLVTRYADVRQALSDPGSARTNGGPVRRCASSYPRAATPARSSAWTTPSTHGSAD